MKCIEKVWCYIIRKESDFPFERPFVFNQSYLWSRDIGSITNVVTNSHAYLVRGKAMKREQSKIDPYEFITSVSFSIVSGICNLICHFLVYRNFARGFPLRIQCRMTCKTLSVVSYSCYKLREIHFCSSLNNKRRTAALLWMYSRRRTLWRTV